jgi:hypothetical protein
MAVLLVARTVLVQARYRQAPTLARAVAHWSHARHAAAK